jgi:hypothetical protein
MRRIVTKAHKIVALALVALLATACSGGAVDQPPKGKVTVSTPPNEGAYPTVAGDFATAVTFTKLVHKDKLKEAGALVKPESAAARYIVHRQGLVKADKIAGYTPEPFKGSFRPDPATGSIKIKDTGGDKKIIYTWKDFTYDQGKVTGWTGKTGPVESVLWSRQSSDSSRGRQAELKSAHLANSGSIFVVVELSSSKGTGWGDAEYAAKDGYRQSASDQSTRNLSRGEKTLALFAFADAELGGKLHIPYYDEDGTSQGIWELELAIR